MHDDVCRLPRNPIPRTPVNNRPWAHPPVSWPRRWQPLAWCLRWRRSSASYPSGSWLSVWCPRGRERNRLQRGRAHALVQPLDGGHLGPADEQAAAGRHYLAPGDELLAVGGRQEVHLVLDREHLAVGWRERHRRVPAGGVGYGGRDGPVEVALLLGDPLGEWHLDDAISLAHLDGFRSQQPHQALAGEARPHPLTGVVPTRRIHASHPQSRLALAREDQAQPQGDQYTASEPPDNTGESQATLQDLAQPSSPYADRAVDDGAVYGVDHPQHQ